MEGTIPSRKKRKLWIFLHKSMKKCTTEPILVYREKFSTNPKFDMYFQGIKEMLQPIKFCILVEKLERLGTGIVLLFPPTNIVKNRNTNDYFTHKSIEIVVCCQICKTYFHKHFIIILFIVSYLVYLPFLTVMMWCTTVMMSC